jgi:hypothetical protein
LLSLLRRALEATPGHALDYDAIARNTLELEVLGFGGIRRLLGVLHGGAGAGGAMNIALTRRGGECTLQAAGCSLLMWAPLVADQARWQAAGDARVEMNIVGARDPLGLLPELAQCAREQWHARLTWPGEAPGELTFLHWNAGGEDPVYGRCPDAGTDSSRAAGIRLSLANAAGHAAFPAASTDRCLTGPEVFADRRQAVLRQGLEMEAGWLDELDHLAAAVLVEASETSRQGAGE